MKSILVGTLVIWQLFVTSFITRSSVLFLLSTKGHHDS